MRRARVKAIAQAAAIVLGSAGLEGRVEEPAAGADSEGFTWRPTYAKGLEAALSRARPFVVYLPPVRQSDEPPVIQHFPRLAGSPPLVEGVRVGADEVVPLLKRFRIKKVPALVLLDRRENVVAGWEGGLTAEVWPRIQAAVKRIDRRDEEDARVLADARRQAVVGGIEAAYRKARPLIESNRTPPDTLEGAKQVEADLLRALHGSILGILAGEGLRSEDDLRRDLEALRSSSVHEGFHARLARELSRLKRTSVGAR